MEASALLYFVLLVFFMSAIFALRSYFLGNPFKARRKIKERNNLIKPGEEGILASEVFWANSRDHPKLLVYKIHTGVLKLTEQSLTLKTGGDRIIRLIKNDPPGQTIFDIPLSELKIACHTWYYPRNPSFKMAEFEIKFNEDTYYFWLTIPLKSFISRELDIEQKWIEALQANTGLAFRDTTFQKATKAIGYIYLIVAVFIVITALTLALKFF